MPETLSNYLKNLKNQKKLVELPVVKLYTFQFFKILAYF
jgi:hypothetical protein